MGRLVTVKEGLASRGRHATVQRESFDGGDLTAARFGRVLTGAPPHGLTNATGAKLENAVLRDLQLDQVIGWPITG